MLEIPESYNMCEQLNQTVKGKKIAKVIANASPHGFAFYSCDPESYDQFLAGKTIECAVPVAGQVEIQMGDTRLLFGDGVNVRFFEKGDKLPPKHQLHMMFEDGSSLVCTVQMYGGMWAFIEGTNENPYYLVAKEKPSPLSDQFDWAYFKKMFDDSKKNLSSKAFLATEQRIPGLGNGVLQDILFNARINPKTKLEKLTKDQVSQMFESVKKTIWDMTEQGGRNTEKDLFGKSCGYRSILSSKTLSEPCRECGGSIVRQAYLGGNVYYCPACQPIV